MSEKPFILEFDSNEHAVLEPEVEHLPFKFHSKLLMRLFQLLILRIS